MKSQTDAPREAEGSWLPQLWSRLVRSSSARHVAFNLTGQGLPLLVAALTVPATVAGLGAARFGLLALALTTLGISVILDVSLSKAVTRFSAEAIARDDRQSLGGILRSAIALQLLVGLVFAGGVWAAAPLVLARGLKLPASMIPDALLAFRILATSAIPNLVLGCFRGFLEAYRRFDLVNLTRGPGAALSFLLPWIGARSGWSLTSIAVALLLSRYLLLLAFAVLSLRIDGTLLRGGTSIPSILSIARFSGYVTASEAIPASIAVWDQFLLGVFASLGAIASFSVPNEIVLRLWLIPTSVIAAFFPVLSGACARGDTPLAARIMKRSAAGILLLLGGPVLLLVVVGPRLLAWWMGARFAESSAQVLQILAAGMLLASLGLVATSALQAEGRPELTARLRLFLVPVWLVVQWKLTETWGLQGAATGVAVRSGLDAMILIALVTVRIRRRTT